MGTHMQQEVPQFKQPSLELLEAWWYGQQQSMVKANEASLRWTKRSEWLDDYCEKNSYNWQQKRDKRMNDPFLADAYGAWTFWQSEVRRFHDMIHSAFVMWNMASILRR